MSIKTSPELTTYGGKLGRYVAPLEPEQEAAPKGREMAYQQRGMEVLKKLESEIESVAKIEQVPTLEGKQMIMVVAPR